MKKLYITAGLMLSMLSVQAQTKHTLKADKLFEAMEYVSAIEEYERVADSKHADSYVYKQLADAYYQVYNMDKAKHWYAKATEKSQDAETYYRYAQVLKSFGEYKEANKQMDKFASMLPTDDRAIAYKANPDYVAQLVDKTQLFNVATTSLNTEKQSTFSAVLTDDNQIYLVSTKNSSNRKDKWVGLPYLDIFSATRHLDGTFSELTPVSELNSAFHDGPVTLSADGRTMIFARDGHAENTYAKNENNKKYKIGQQGLYKAVLQNGKWSNIEALPFNSTSYSVSHPSLSKDGKTLYFASNMPGGLGDTDIWKVSVTETGYGTPVNLGPSVNTAGKEAFPFIADDGTLYFSSTGKPGLGGYDIFMLEKSATQAVNLGKPVNTVNDDFSFAFNQKHNIALFASNRGGNDRVYSASPICKVSIITNVKDRQTGKAIAGAEVIILDGKKNVVAKEVSNSKGEVTFDVLCDVDYVIQASHSKYDAAQSAFNKTNDKNAVVDIALDPLQVVITETEVVLNDVYFEFDKSNITQAGAKELDKLVQVMKENPSMEIFVKSHTDNRGTSQYNLNLSERRAKATVQYTISKGIAKSRISGKGFGTSEPKVKCENCTEEQDAQNRRSEFMIVKK